MRLKALGLQSLGSSLQTARTTCPRDILTWGHSPCSLWLSCCFRKVLWDLPRFPIHGGHLGLQSSKPFSLGLGDGFCVPLWPVAAPDAALWEGSLLVASSLSLLSNTRAWVPPHCYLPPLHPAWLSIRMILSSTCLQTRKAV